MPRGRDVSAISEELLDSKTATTFASKFIARYLDPAFGPRSKSETDLLVFSCLIQDRLRRKLVSDKHLPDRSLKALATEVLLTLGEKVADKAGGDIADAIIQSAGKTVVKPAVERLTGFLTGLLRGYPDGAASMLAEGDIHPAERKRDTKAGFDAGCTSVRVALA